MRANQFKKETTIMRKVKNGGVVRGTSKVVMQAEYEVEKICEKRVHCGKVQYLLKWKDYSSLFNSWEPAENLTNCSQLIKQFEQAQRLVEKQQQQQQQRSPMTAEVN